MGSRYDWQDPSSPIKQIDVTKNAGGWLQVVIYAPQNFDSKLATLPQYLTKRGYITYGDTVEGQQVYKIADFGKKEEPILDVLRNGGFTAGAPKKSDTPDHIQELTGLEKVRRYSANLSGIFGIAGHALQIVYGKLTGDKNRITAGVLYGTSNMLGAAFGSGAGPIQFSRITSGLHDFLHKEGLTFTEPLIKTPEITYRERTLGHRVWDMAKTHPIQVLNAIALPGNIALLRSGLMEASHRKDMPLLKRPGIGTAGAAAVAATSALIAVVIPEVSEEKLDQFRKRKGFLKCLKDGEIGEAFKILPDSVYMFIARKPLAVQGALLLSDNALMLKDAYETSKSYQQNISNGMHRAEPPLKWAIASLYSTSSLFTGITTEKRHEYYESPQAYEGLYTQVANLLLTSPRGTTPEIIKHTAAFLAADRDVRIHENQIEQGLTDKIRELQNNPWIKSALKEVDTQQAATPQTPATSPAAPDASHHAADSSTHPAHHENAAAPQNAPEHAAAATASKGYVDKVRPQAQATPGMAPKATNDLKPRPLPTTPPESWTQRRDSETATDPALSGASIRA
ncbi:MAG TPA: hypothetical protein VFT64_10450 [Rickettsiales bacterium]|nr:hypothetical protein [Rickettsiales bacterium]